MYGDKARRFKCQATVKYSADQKPVEISITFPKGSMLGSDFQAAAQDGARMLSVLLQHGVSLETIRHALTRNDDGTASSLTGAIVDRLSSGTSGQQKL
jgi:hypothetical protein